MEYSYKPIENKFVKSNTYNITNYIHFVYMLYTEFNPQVQHSLLVMDSTNQGVFWAES